jgi:hypothetical protein
MGETSLCKVREGAAECAGRWQIGCLVDLELLPCDDLEACCCLHIIHDRKIQKAKLPQFDPYFVIGNARRTATFGLSIRFKRREDAADSGRDER